MDLPLYLGSLASPSGILRVAVFMGQDGCSHVKQALSQSPLLPKASWCLRGANSLSERLSELTFTVTNADGFELHFEVQPARRPGQCAQAWKERHWPVCTSTERKTPATGEKHLCNLLAVGPWRNFLNSKLGLPHLGNGKSRVEQL